MRNSYLGIVWRWSEDWREEMFEVRMVAKIHKFCVRRAVLASAWWGLRRTNQRRRLISQQN